MRKKCLRLHIRLGEKDSRAARGARIRSDVVGSKNQKSRGDPHTGKLKVAVENRKRGRGILSVDLEGKNTVKTRQKQQDEREQVAYATGGSSSRL